MPKIKSLTTVKIEAHVRANPNTTVDDICKTLKIKNRKQVSNVLGRIRRTTTLQRTTATVVGCQPTRIQIHIPDEGIELKIAKNGVLFTLDIKEDGILFIPSNAKKKPIKRVPWSFLKLFQDSMFSFHEG